MIVIEAGPRTGVLARLSGGSDGPVAYRDGGNAARALQAAGFKPVRLVAERDGFTFTEGLKSS